MKTAVCPVCGRRVRVIHNRWGEPVLVRHMIGSVMDGSTSRERERAGSMNRIINKNRLTKYYFQVANIVDDLPLSVYAFRLYAHLVRVSSLRDADISTRELARACRMSAGRIVAAKRELAEALLIAIEERKGDRGRPYHVITLLDIAAQNVEHCQSSPGELISSSGDTISSPDELISSPHELISSRGDTPYKNIQELQELTKTHGALSGESAPRASGDTSESVRKADEILLTHASGDRTEKAILRARCSEPARDLMRAFYSLTKIVYTKSWPSAAETMAGAGVTDADLRAALEEARAGQWTVNDPHSLTKTAIRIASERRAGVVRPKPTPGANGRLTRRAQVPESTEAERERAREAARKRIEERARRKAIEAAQ